MAHWTRGYIGIPFLHHGRDKTGVDCWGLVALVYREMFGIELPEVADLYSEVKTEAEIEAVMNRQESAAIWEPVETAQEGTLLVFRHGVCPMHCGIALDGRTFLHSIAPSGVVIESLCGPMWRLRLTGMFRYAGARRKAVQNVA